MAVLAPFVCPSANALADTGVAADSFPAFCPDGDYCATSAMLQLNGAGLNAHAYIYFHNHDDHSYTIDGVKVVNNSTTQPCSLVWKLENHSTGDEVVDPPAGSYRCADGVVVAYANFGLPHGYFNGAFNWGVVTVTLYGSFAATSHSLSTDDFGLNNAAHPCSYPGWNKPNRVRCGDF